MKDDKIWNFVLSCPHCNERKNNKLPAKEYLIQIEARNKRVCELNDVIVRTDFEGYTDDLLGRMWRYAQLGGLKEYAWEELKNA